MAAQINRRPRRTPLSREEVAHIIAIKKRKEEILLIQFKKSPVYKIQNILNMCCFFIYWEVILCFFGPCTYQVHFAEMVMSRHGQEYNANNKPITSELKIRDVNGSEYDLVVEDYIERPDNYTRFLIGKDFILGKKLKGKIQNSETSYRLFSASPVLLLSVFALLISSIVMVNDLNHKAYSLSALTVLNCLIMLSIIGL